MENIVRRLQQLNTMEIYVELKTSYKEARDVANALKDYEVLSDNSKDRHQMAADLSCSEGTVDVKRSILIRNNLLKPRRAGRKSEIGSLKKLNTLESKPYATYRFPYITEREMKAAKLDSKGKYFCVVEPIERGFLVKILEPEEAIKHRKS